MNHKVTVCGITFLLKSNRRDGYGNPRPMFDHEVKSWQHNMEQVLTGTYSNHLEVCALLATSEQVSGEYDGTAKRCGTCNYSL